MQTIALIAQKGGTGKTTMALSLAVAAVQDGRTVAVIDLDPQASAGNWADRRAMKDAPAVVSAHVPRLQSVIDTARQNGVDLLIIDTPGKSEQAALAAAKAADPVRDEGDHRSCRRPACLRDPQRGPAARPSA